MKNLNLMTVNLYETLIKIVVLMLVTAVLTYILSILAKLINKDLVESTVNIEELKNW